MPDEEITTQNIETGISESVGALQQSYLDEQDAINAILGQSYIGLNIPSDVQGIIDNEAQQGTFTGHLYDNTIDETEKAAGQYALDLGEKALVAQKNLGRINNVYIECYCGGGRFSTELRRYFAPSFYGHKR